MPCSFAFPWIDRAVSQQSQIGWFAFLNGFISKEWREAQARYYHHLDVAQPRPFARSTRRWTAAIISKARDVAWDMWRHRNGVKHGGHSHLDKQLHAQFDERIFEQYSRGAADMEEESRGLLDTPINDTKEWDLDTKRLWLESVKLSRESFRRTKAKAARQLHRQQSLLANWLLGNGS